MPIRVSDLRLSVEEPEAALAGPLARALGVRPDEVRQWRILRKSLDARDKAALQYVYAAEVRLPEGEPAVVERARRAHGRARVDLYEEPPFVMPPPGTAPLPERPVVIGSGPGGLAAGYFLALQGYRPLVLER